MVAFLLQKKKNRDFADWREPGWHHIVRWVVECIQSFSQSIISEWWELPQEIISSFIIRMSVALPLCVWSEQTFKAEGVWQSQVIELWGTHPVQHVCPALHGDTLKHCQHSKQEVVKVGDAIVGTLPAFPALCAIGALSPMPWDRTWSLFIFK